MSDWSLTRGQPADVVCDFLLHQEPIPMTEPPLFPDYLPSYSEGIHMKNVIATPMKIGFLGLGIMGTGMVNNLLKSGHEVTVWNRTPSKVPATTSENKVLTLLKSTCLALKLLYGQWCYLRQRTTVPNLSLYKTIWVKHMIMATQKWYGTLQGKGWIEIFHKNQGITIGTFILCLYCIPSQLQLTCFFRGGDWMSRRMAWENISLAYFS